MAYTIIEVANTHAGNVDYVFELIDTFAGYKGDYGIKFQPLSPDTLATKDYEWYPVYQQLLFSNAEWNEIINRSSTTKDVWLDLFDSYGVQILAENIDKIHGIKFQTSVLYNYNLFDALAKIDLSDKKVIINIAAQPLSDISDIIKRIESILKPSELLFEVGFQAYPTKLEDSGINKIKVIKENFGKRIVFADHTDGKTDDAIWLPIVALLEGADLIEKHVMLSTRETKYDFYSSITPEQFATLSSNLERYGSLRDKEFINEKEIDYLNKSIMTPILKVDKLRGDGLDLHQEFDFKRSGKSGLNVKEIEDLKSKFYLLNTDKKAGDTLQKYDFSKANIGAIIACRMKSTRLPKKAILKLGELPSVELCIKNALAFSNVNRVVLATSTEEEDSILKDYTYNPSVSFYQGHPIDVMQRVVDVLEHEKLDVFIRITADMPYVDDEILQILLKSHFESGADYTRANDAAIGTNLEIINAAALKKVKSFFPNADYSEYMTYYFTNNAKHFKLNFVDLPESIIRNYRLTLDYEEDLILFNKIEEYLTSKKLNHTLRNIFTYLDENPEIAAINMGMEVKYYTDKDLINRINKYTTIE